ncbi:MAG: hypothetical protein JOZ75_07250 [Candidatus Dormibacteraeota bacterium]|nr:hypothetical protein [Candidatus Dormibacteraeota bacterium]
MGARAKILSASALCLSAAALVPAVIVFACVSVASLTATPQSVQPGGVVTVNGGDYVPGFPVQIHLDTPTGPTLATVASPTGPSSMRSAFKVDVTLPSGLSSGQHTLLATQDAHNMTSGIPARAVIYVGTGVPAAPQSTRSAAPVVDTGLSVGALALIAVAAAAAGLLVLGAVVVLTSRRPPRTGAAGA